MLVKLGLDDVKLGRTRSVPMSGPITDMTPCTPEERKLFMKATGCIGWISGTGRPDLRVYHSRISQYMANPVRGALDAILGVVKYCAAHKDLCLHQPWGTDPETFGWRFASDSDQSSNTELNNKMRSQLSFIATRGHAPVMFGSKSKLMTRPSLDSFGKSIRGLDKPTCHPKMKQLHADVSSAAAEIFAVSIALNEFLHLAYVTDEMGFFFPRPIELQVDNSTAIHFSKGSTRRSKLRHIDARQEWVCALRDESIVKLVKVDTKENLADLNSKFLDVPTFEKLRGRIMTARAIPELSEVAAAA
jgi:hypothetical protein